jgi:hypothetical protein
MIWAVAAYGSETVRCFSLAYFSHLQGRKSELDACLCRCLLGLLFDPEDGGDMFLRNVGLSPNYTALHPRTLALQNHPSRSTNLRNK